MILKHRGKTLRVRDCKGVKSIFGLTLHPLITLDGALVYTNNIGTFLCRTLDLYFLDNNFVVLEKQTARHFLHPRSWKGYRNKEAKYTLEVKKGLADFKKGEKISIK